MNINEFEDPRTFDPDKQRLLDEWIEDVRALSPNDWEDRWSTEWVERVRDVAGQIVDIGTNDKELAVHQGAMGILFLALELHCHEHAKAKEPKPRVRVKRILSTGEIIRTASESNWSFNRKVAMQTKPNTLTRADWNSCLEYFNHSCAVCGRQQGLFHTIAKDHWIPISDTSSPGTVAWNIVPLCHGSGGCNNSKGSTNPHDWLVSVYGIKKAKAIEQRIGEYFTLVKVERPES